MVEEQFKSLRRTWGGVSCLVVLILMFIGCVVFKDDAYPDHAWTHASSVELNQGLSIILHKHYPLDWKEFESNNAEVYLNLFSVCLSPIDLQNRTFAPTCLEKDEIDQLDPHGQGVGRGLIVSKLFSITFALMLIALVVILTLMCTRPSSSFYISRIMAAALLIFTAMCFTVAGVAYGFSILQDPAYVISDRPTIHLDALKSRIAFFCVQLVVYVFTVISLLALIPYSSKLRNSHTPTYYHPGDRYSPFVNMKDFS